MILLQFISVRITLMQNRICHRIHIRSLFFSQSTVRDCAKSFYCLWVKVGKSCSLKNNYFFNVQPFQETLHGSYCGPASLRIVLDYYGVEKTEEEVAKICGRDPDIRTDASSIKKAAVSFGFKAEIQNDSSFDDIQRWLDKKVPVIVDWFTRGRADYDDSEVPDGHYSVVVGLDKDNIYLQDPEIGKMRTLKRDDFMRVWFDFKSSQITSWDEMIIRQLIAIQKNNEKR